MDTKCAKCFTIFTRRGNIWVRADNTRVLICPQCMETTPLPKPKPKKRYIVPVKELATLLRLFIAAEIPIKTDEDQADYMKACTWINRINKWTK